VATRRRRRKGKLVANKLHLPDTHEFPKVEVIVRNQGDQIAVLKAAIFHVERIFVFHNIGHPAALPTSWTYDVMLPVDKKAPYDIQIPISQTVPPDGADKFAFRLGNNGSPYGDSMGGGPETYVFDVHIELVYNENNNKLRFADFLIASSPASQVVAVTTEPGDDFIFDENGNKTTFSALNAARASELSKVKAIRSNWVKQILGDQSQPML
jgi:hypothetical protein